MTKTQKEGAFLEMVSGLGSNRWCSACFLVYPDDGKTCSCFVAGEVMTTTLRFRRRPDLQLLQNCDLPPPVKVFAGDERGPIIETVPSLHSLPFINITSKLEDEDQSPDRLDLLKALQLAQTRAREAETQASLLCDEKEKLTALLWTESSKLFAHQQWLKLLEMEICQLRSQLALLQMENRPEMEQIDLEKMNASDWTVALLVGVAAFGLAFGCKYFLS